MTERLDSAPVIVLLAAGEGRRFGGIKQLADINGETMVHRAARTAIASGAKLIAVTGAHAEQVSLALSHLPLHILHHAGWADGMGSSLAAGIHYVVDHFPQVTGALLCLADQPLLETSCYTRMLERHRQAPERILATAQNGVAGPPALFPKHCFAELMQWSGDRGAQALLRRKAERVELFEWPDMIDIDNPDDLALARSRLAANRLD